MIHRHSRREDHERKHDEKSRSSVSCAVDRDGCDADAADRGDDAVGDADGTRRVGADRRLSHTGREYPHPDPARIRQQGAGLDGSRQGRCG